MITKDRRKICNIMAAIGIIWIMSGLFSFNSFAKSTFSKTKPEGVMSTAIKTEIVVSWEPVKGADGYQVYEAKKEDNREKMLYEVAATTSQCRLIRTEMIPGEVYFYYVRAYQTSKKGEKKFSAPSPKVSTMVPVKGTSTIKNLLKTALAPVGSTMYVWGGGWNKADTGAGTDAKRIGLSPVWRNFAKNKKASYNYKNYRYQIHNGLDCSGYVGWCVYNVLQTRPNKKGYVYSASKQAKKFSELGFGSYRTAEKVKDYRAGDIMSSTCKCCGHVWIAVGQCKDGSVVLLHSSPTGVQLCGTTTLSGKKNSEAYKLAKKYMKKYYKTWYNKYPDVSRGKTYLSHYSQMRWQTSGESIQLSDPDGYQNMSAKEVLADLFP